MKFRFEFEIFGKKMAANVSGKDRDEARAALFKKITESVKIIDVEKIDKSGEWVEKDTFLGKMSFRKDFLDELGIK